MSLHHPDQIASMLCLVLRVRGGMQFFVEQSALDLERLDSTDSVKAQFQIREATLADQRGSIFVGTHGRNLHTDSALDLVLERVVACKSLW